MFKLPDNLKKLDFLKESDKKKLQLLFLSTLVGIIGGLGAVMFRLLIKLVNLTLVKFPNTISSDFNPLIIVLAPTVGGLIVGAIVYFGAREAKGHGVPEIIQSVNIDDGKMRWRVPFVKILASAITIGSGGSAGREGPIAQIGGGFASVLAQKFHLSKDDSKTLVIAGVSAGISATFNAPLGGVLFGYEVIRRDRKTFSILPLIISSVVGTTIGEIFLGTDPAFNFPFYTANNSFRNIFLFTLLGISMGFFAVLWVRSFYIIEELLEKIPISPILLAGFGGMMVGLIELKIPEVNGISYDPIDDAFALKFALQTLIILALAKILATSLSIGSGGSGGVFAPTLFQGVMLGSFFGLILVDLGYSDVPVNVFALLGMAALFAGSARAPLTAIIMTSEMVNDFELIIPLMFAVISSWLISGIFLSEDIYTLKIKKRGIDFTPSIDILDEIPVSEVMVKQPISVSPKDRIEYIIELMEKTGHTGYPVVFNGELIGVITEHDVDKALSHVEMQNWIVSEICTKNVFYTIQEHPLSLAFAKMAKKNVNRLPVVTHNNPNQLVGWITRSDIMRIYLQKKSFNKTEEFEYQLLEKTQKDEFTPIKTSKPVEIHQESDTLERFQICSECNSYQSIFNKSCSNCGNQLKSCFICDKGFVPSDNTINCQQCNTFFHDKHFFDDTQMKVCPNCREVSLQS